MSISKISFFTNKYIFGNTLNFKLEYINKNNVVDNIFSFEINRRVGKENRYQIMRENITNKL